MVFYGGPHLPVPAVVFRPDAGARLKRGFDVLAELLARTIGPLQRQILSAGSPSTGPEVLVDAATVARRFLALPDRREDVGAMLARNLVWRMHQTAGDGCATAVALAQAMIAAALRSCEAGADVAALRLGMTAATDAALDALQAMARPICGERDLLHVAQTATGEPRISALLAEIYDILGADAYVMVEEYLAPYLEREYLQGGQWKAHLVSPFLLTSPELQSAVMHDAAVALFAGDIGDLDAVRPLLEILATTERRLLLVANRIDGSALTTLVLNHERKQIQLVAATLYRAGELNRHDFEDLALLTSARLLSPETGDRLQTIKPADLGTARYVRLAADRLIVSERGDSPAARAHMSALRQQLARIVVDREDDRAEIRLRIGRLSGAVATLKVGAPTRTEGAMLQQKAEEGIRALDLAMRDGVVPGGGLAYLRCIPVVRQLCLAGDAWVGAAIVAQALEAPFRWIVANAGLRTPAVVLDEMRRHGPHAGYDALADQVVDIEAAGILDSASVLRTALRAATSAATMVLTTDVLVLKRHPELSVQP